MSIRFRSVVRGLVLVALLGSAHGADRYVDALHGDNTNDGASPATAWRTLTHALANVPYFGAETIHVAPGTYDAALGESFPIQLRGDVVIVGDQGAAATILDGAGVALDLVLLSANIGDPPVAPGTGLRGLTLRNGGRGFVFEDYGVPYDFELYDVVIEGMSARGAQLGIQAVTSNAWMRFERVVVQHCATGVYLADLATSTTHLVFTDCELSDNASDGLLLSNQFSTVETKLLRCRVERNGTNAVRIAGMGSTIDIDSSLIARNGADALSHIGGGTLHARHSTFAYNVGEGIPTWTGFPNMFFAVLESCIVHDNGDDVREPTTLTATRCIFSDGTFDGLNGNSSANPMFRDATADRFDLSWGSPCIDAGDPVGVSGELDLLGGSFDIDGDLDTLARSDIGCFEFRPLQLASSPQLGTVLRFDVFGLPDAVADLAFSRQPSSAPLATLFGDARLVPGTALALRTLVAQPWPTAQVVRLIPNHPALIGRTFGFQALVDSPLAPNGRAYTNAVDLTFVP